MKGAATVLGLESPLLDLLGQEFSSEGLTRLLGAVGEQVPRQVWESALRAPLKSVLGRPGKGFRARLVATSYGLAGGAARLTLEREHRRGTPRAGAPAPDHGARRPRRGGRTDGAPGWSEAGDRPTGEGL